jgi:hypothetical protein
MSEAGRSSKSKTRARLTKSLMSVVSSTDVECFRRLTNPEVVDVNEAKGSTRQIAQQMRQAMEQAVSAARQKEDLRRDGSDDSEEDKQSRRSSNKPVSRPSRLAAAMQIVRQAVPATEEPVKGPPAPTAASPSSLPVPEEAKKAQPPSFISSPAAPPHAPTAAARRSERELAAEESSDNDDDEGSVKVQRDDPEALRLEKQGYLIELQELQSKGVKLSRGFTMKDSLTELEFEVQRQNSNLSTWSTVANMKDVLKIVFNGLEMCNAKFGPFLCLDGWAETITGDMKRFDSALEKLYKRYWRKQQMSPVWELGMIVLGSLAMHHFKAKIFGPVHRSSASQAKSPSVTLEESHGAAGAPSPPPLRPRGRGGTPAHSVRGSLGRKPPSPAEPQSRPTLRPPSSIFGF